MTDTHHPACTMPLWCPSPAALATYLAEHTTTLPPAPVPVSLAALCWYSTPHPGQRGSHMLHGMPAVNRFTHLKQARMRRAKPYQVVSPIQRWSKDHLTDVYCVYVHNAMQRPHTRLRMQVRRGQRGATPWSRLGCQCPPGQQLWLMHPVLLQKLRACGRQGRHRAAHAVRRVTVVLPTLCGAPVRTRCGTCSGSSARVSHACTSSWLLGGSAYHTVQYALAAHA